MLTPYETHKNLNHKTSFYSPNGIDKIEECSECSARFLHVTFLMSDGVNHPPISLLSNINKTKGANK